MARRAGTAIWLYPAGGKKIHAFWPKPDVQPPTAEGTASLCRKFFIYDPAVTSPAKGNSVKCAKCTRIEDNS